MGMQEWLNLILGAGQLSGLLILVLIFVNYIKGRDEQIQKVHQRCEEKIELLTDKAIEAFKENTEAVKDLERRILEIR